MNDTIYNYEHLFLVAPFANRQFMGTTGWFVWTGEYSTARDLLAAAGSPA